MKRLIAATALIGFLVACSNGQEGQPEPREAFEQNLKGLLSTNGEARRKAFEVYQRNWPQWREYTTALADRTHVPTRIAGAYLVGRLGTEEDLPTLRKFLSDGSFVVRKMAMTGVLRLEDADSVPTLVGILDEAKYAEVQLILKTLIRIDPEAGERACVKRAADQRWAHRRAAAESLGLLESGSSGLVLERLLGDPVWLVQRDAAEAVGRRRYQGGHPGLLKLLDSEQAAVRSSVATALGRFGRASDLGAVKSLAFEDPDHVVRVAAVEALSGFSEDSVLPLIESVLNRTEDREVHKAALRCLIAMGKGRPERLLHKILVGEDRGMRDLAEAVLREEDEPR